MYNKRRKIWVIFFTCLIALVSTPCLRKAGTFLWSECNSLSRSAGYAESSSSICLLFRPSYPGNYFFFVTKRTVKFYSFQSKAL